jgi:ribosomal protein S18 acetylase RimI-like enzyme
MDLVAAAASVQSNWMVSVARATRGRVWVQDGVACCSKPGEMAIRFPDRLPEAALDRILAWADEHGLTVGCWSAHEMPADIASTLASRGFDEGWRSHWMAIEARPAQEDARMAEATAVAEWDDYGQALLGMLGERTRLFVARGEGGLHGFAWLHAPPGDFAGMFDLVVFPAFRRQGLGRALTAAVCTHAADLGCSHVVLNATEDGEQLYRSMGFESAGHGRTWWRHGSASRTVGP